MLKKKKIMYTDAYKILFNEIMFRYSLYILYQLHITLMDLRETSKMKKKVQYTCVV